MKETHPIKLHDGGADVNCVDDESLNAIGLRRALGHMEMVKLLLANGADVNKSGAPWFTPLAGRARRIIRKCMLLETGAK